MHEIVHCGMSQRAIEIYSLLVYLILVSLSTELVFFLFGDLFSLELQKNGCQLLERDGVKLELNIVEESHN